MQLIIIHNYLNLQMFSFSNAKYFTKVVYSRIMQYREVLRDSFLIRFFFFLFHNHNSLSSL